MENRQTVADRRRDLIVVTSEARTRVNSAYLGIHHGLAEGDSEPSAHHSNSKLFSRFSWPSGALSHCAFTI